MAVPSQSPYFQESDLDSLQSRKPVQLKSRRWSCADIEAGQQHLKRAKLEPNTDEDDQLAALQSKIDVTRHRIIVCQDGACLASAPPSPCLNPLKRENLSFGWLYRCDDMVL